MSTTRFEPKIEETPIEQTNKLKTSILGMMGKSITLKPFGDKRYENDSSDNMRSLSNDISSLMKMKNSGE